MWSGVIISEAGDGEKNVPRTARTHLLAEVRTHARCVPGCLIVQVQAGEYSADY